MPLHDPGPRLPVCTPHPPERRALGADEASSTSSAGLSTGQLTSCCARACSRSYSLPPSPPLTNPHLKRAIPLPCFHEECHHYVDAHVVPASARTPMEEENDSRKSLSRLQGVAAGSALLSPPYSPCRQSLQLLSLDELGEDEPSYNPQPGPSDVLDFGWREDDMDDSERVEPQVDGRGLIGMDFDDKDDWDEPLFLRNPSSSTLDESEGLDLALFGPSSSSRESPRGFSAVLSSPSLRSSSLLPDIDDLPEDRSSNALLNPSDFDVFNNGWDTIVSDSTQSTSPSKQVSGEEALDFGPVYDFSFGETQNTSHPVSPSRRSVINLPGADDDFNDDSEPIIPPRPTSPVNLPDPGSCISFASSPWYRTFDVPLDSFQSPFTLPLLLSPQATTNQSLLFEPDPECIPLPESPVDERHLLGLPESVSDVDGDDDGITDVPLHLLEETRLCVLHHESLVAERQARTNETMLTEYIRRLNELQPPREPITSPVDCSAVLDDTPSSASNAGPGPATLHFLTTRRKEVQNLISLRAVERRKRKRAKERGRELEALLQLKSAQLRADALRNRSRSRLSSRPHAGSGSDTDEAIVLTASGADRRQAHPHDVQIDDQGSLVDVGSSSKGKQEEILQLVAKMIFRRRDSPRPLTGKVLSPSRPYRRSRLSQTDGVENETGTLEDTN